MTIENNQLADEVVSAFKKVLSEDALSHISDKEFHELNLMVHEALSKQLSHTADIVDNTVKQLRAMTEHQDIGL